MGEVCLVISSVIQELLISYQVMVTLKLLTLG